MTGWRPSWWWRVAPFVGDLALDTIGAFIGVGMVLSVLCLTVYGATLLPEPATRHVAGMAVMAVSVGLTFRNGFWGLLFPVGLLLY